jgi:hypothetical protein
MPEFTDPTQLAEVTGRLNDLTEAHRRLVEAIHGDPDAAADQVAAARRAALAMVGTLFRQPDGGASDYEMTPRRLLSDAAAQLTEAARLVEDPAQAAHCRDLASQLAVYAPHEKLAPTGPERDRSPG